MRAEAEQKRLALERARKEEEEQRAEERRRDMERELEERRRAEQARKPVSTTLLRHTQRVPKLYRNFRMKKEAFLLFLLETTSRKC